MQKSSEKGLENVVKKSTLRLCMKKYKNGVFTQFLFSSQSDKKFSVMGPYGRGLRLTRKSTGFYIIIAAGTGILPFIDLFHFLLQKTFLELIAEMSGEEVAKKLNEEKVDYGQLDGIKILLIGSFEGPKYFYLDSVIRDLYYLNQKHELRKKLY
jgi:predicted ferric reductase